MNEQRRTSRAAKPAGNKTSVSAKTHAGRTTDKPSTSVRKLFGGPAKNSGAEVNTSRETTKTKSYLDSRRRGLTEASPVDHVDREFWKHVFAEVSAFRYPAFLHRLDSKAKEAEAIDHFYKLCKTLLTKEECQEAARSRLTRRAERKEIKLYD